jgi:AAHS family benzoate transporter-like MFS transporter
MGFTALSTTTTMFGIGRFLTGIGVGALVGTTGALVSEFAPPGKKNLCNAITYSGVPFGSLLAALLGIILLDSIGWRGMFWIGALPLVTLLPLAYFKMPESVAWLVSRGRIEEAQRLSARTGMQMPEHVAPVAQTDQPTVTPTGGRAGYAGLFDRYNWLPTVLLGLTSAMVLLLVYSLNTWLPELMQRAGYDAKGSLAFLLVLNGGAVISALTGARFADRFGPKLVISLFLLTGAVFIAALTIPVSVGVLLVFVALAGLGTSGTQILLFGLVANYYRTNVRAAGVAWCAGFGRLGGVGGPLIGGILIGAGLGMTQIFFILAGVAVLGLVLILLVPQRRDQPKVVTVDPSKPFAREAG